MLSDGEQRKYWKFLRDSGINYGMRFMTVLPYLLDYLNRYTGGSVRYDRTYKDFRSSTEKYIVTSDWDVLSYIEEDINHGEQKASDECRGHNR